jgi:thiosulfate dehydrogenase
MSTLICLRNVVVTAALLWGSAMLGACGPAVPAGPIAAARYGEQLFADPTLSTSAFNTVSCATCHSVGSHTQARIDAGANLQESAHRTSWWGGDEPTYLEAVNACLVIFMRAEPLTSTDEKGRALYEYLASVSPTPSTPPVPFTVVENITSVARGDAKQGAAVWDHACLPCHGEPHTGQGRLSALVSTVPEDSAVFAKQHGATTDLVVIEKVRHGAFFGVGGTMPPFSAETLSDEQLGQLLAFLGI